MNAPAKGRLSAVDRPGGSARGQSLTELALTLPVLMLFTVGVVDMARAYTAWIAISGGVREAALYAAEGANYANDATIDARVRGEAAGLAPAKLAIIGPTCGGGACSDSSASVTVGATYQFDLIFPVLTDLFPGGVTLSADATVPRIDRGP